MFMSKMPRSATPRKASMSRIRSASVTGAATGCGGDGSAGLPIGRSGGSAGELRCAAGAAGYTGDSQERQEYTERFEEGTPIFLEMYDLPTSSRRHCAG